MANVIKMGEGNTSGVLIPLITFDCLFDTDFGLLTHIDREYTLGGVFSADFFNSHRTVVSMVTALFDRDEENPLSLCVDNQDEASKLYEQFMLLEYGKILPLSMPTELYNTLFAFENMDIKATIVCKNKDEIEFLNSHTKIKQIILLEDLQTIDTYQQFFFKSVNDIYMRAFYKFIKRSTVYIASYKFNSSDRTADNKYMEELIMNGRNVFKDFDIYSKDKLKNPNKYIIKGETTNGQ